LVIVIIISNELYWSINMNCWIQVGRMLDVSQYYMRNNIALFMESLVILIDKGQSGIISSTMNNFIFQLQ